MQDSVEITLPVSGSKVEIRNYTTEDDDSRAEKVLYAGVNAKKTLDGSPVDVEFPMENIAASQKSYVPRLVKTIDGESADIHNRLIALRSEDYAAVYDAIEKIVEEHSPKAKGASKPSKTDTAAK